MPLTSTKPQLPMLIIRNSKLSKLKIISSSSTTYYTILQTQTHENVQQLWCYREELPHTAVCEALCPCPLPDSTAMQLLVRTDQPRPGRSDLVRTAGSTVNCAPRMSLSLAYALLLCGTFSCRSQQVQNKVTTRFNKLIYIC